MKRFALVVAGGSGERFQSSTPKQFALLAGRTVLAHSLIAFHSFDKAIQLIVVMHSDFIQNWKEICASDSSIPAHVVVEGGKNRFDSVKNGLKLVKEDGYVAVHDAVRPNISNDLLKRCFETAEKLGNAVPSIPLKDSLRELREDGSKPVPREKYQMVQTPQVFHSEELVFAYNSSVYQNSFTDDASVVEASGNKIHLVMGETRNIKITYPEDLKYLEALWSN